MELVYSRFLAKLNAKKLMVENIRTPSFFYGILGWLNCKVD